MMGRADFAGSAGTGTRAGRLSPAVAVAMVAALLPAVPAGAAPSAGDAYVYQVVNAYNREVQGRLHYQVERVEAERVMMSVNPDRADAGIARTEIYTREGNWLRHPIESHGVPVEYEFATAYPAYVFPLEPGKSWSIRIQATVPATGERRSVRVDGRVLGRERVRVPAGEFDAIKVRRIVYPGDAYFTVTETNIVETDWYVPSLGIPVRRERDSGWLDLSRCMRGGGCDFRGSWELLELVEARPAGKS